MSRRDLERQLRRVRRRHDRGSTPTRWEVAYLMLCHVSESPDVPTTLRQLCETLEAYEAKIKREACGRLNDAKHPRLRRLREDGPTFYKVLDAVRSA